MPPQVKHTLFFLCIFCTFLPCVTFAANTHYKKPVMVAQNHLDIDFFEEEESFDHAQQVKKFHQTQREQAQERLILNGTIISLTIGALFLLARKGTAIANFIQLRPLRLPRSRKAKVFISANILWTLSLLFTNSFQFEYIDSEDWQRFGTFSALFFIFSLIALLLYTWIERPEKIADKKNTEAPRTSAFTDFKRGNKFYIKRTALLATLTVPLLAIETLLFTILDTPTSVRPDFVMGGFLFMILLVLSKPLGFWRKIACWLLGMATLIFSRSLLLEVVIDTIALTAPTQTESSFATTGSAFKQMIHASFIVSVIAISIGFCAVKASQQRWLKILTKQN